VTRTIAFESIDAPERSAFAAGVFSALFPGLGQLYAGRPRRALAWALLPLLIVVALVGLTVAATRGALPIAVLAQLASPQTLIAALVANAALFLYRAAAIVDAYRVASGPQGRGRGRAYGTGTGSSSAASLIGLVALLMVVSLGHLAVGRLNLAAYGTITGLGGGDPSAVTGDGSPVASSSPSTSPGPDSSPAAVAWNGSGRLNILLIGADHRPGGGEYLTDTMIVASIDPATKNVAMFSLPRDTANVPLPPTWPAAKKYANGVFPRKINSLYTVARADPASFPGDDAQRGFLALKGALGQLYGIDISYYIAVDFQGFLDVVDALGGVTVDVQVPVRDYHYPADDGRGSLNLYIPPGIHHFDGPTALAYARARHQTSDFDRAQRQQRIVTSIGRQVDLASLLVPGRIDALMGVVRNSVRTDIPADLFPSLVTLADGVDLNSVASIVFTPPKYGTECFPCGRTGVYLIRPDVAAIRAEVKAVLAAPAPEGAATP
jgi:polyisoprenyl-teichoic acid--peptidoglycan teichoic acid transferase